MALRRQNLNLPQLRDNPFCIMSFLDHSSILHRLKKPYIRKDHFSGGRPLAPTSKLADIWPNSIWRQPELDGITHRQLAFSFHPYRNAPLVLGVIYKAARLLPKMPLQ